MKLANFQHGHKGIEFFFLQQTVQCSNWLTTTISHSVLLKLFSTSNTVIISNKLYLNTGLQSLTLFNSMYIPYSYL